MESFTTMAGKQYYALLTLFLFVGLARGIEDDAGLKRSASEESIHAGTDEKVGDVGASSEEGRQHVEGEGEAVGLDDSSKFPEEVRDPHWWVYEIDADSDGKVTRVEIVEWIMQNEDKGNSKEIDLQWAIYDSDHNGRVSWEEYRTVFLKKSGVPTEDLDDETMQTMYTKSEKGRFTHADADKDGDLSKEELKAILFPHHHDHMVDHLVQELLNEIDQDNDGFIQPHEYRRVYLDMFGHVDEVGDETDLDEQTRDRIEKEMERFTKDLDVNKDGHLDKEELEPMVVRRRRATATAEANKIFEQSDKNKDGELTHDEVLQSYDRFMSDYYVDDDDDDDDVVDEGHDEL